MIGTVSRDRHKEYSLRSWGYDWVVECIPNMHQVLHATTECIPNMCQVLHATTATTNIKQ